ncbi:HAMP domain-containing sensor histidine kinase [Bacillus thuringiensis]|nr:HAMP domain-containing sensor histidine kinase [Bacillus thuringiensis]MED2808555.1 HAMP domain-containing sensor histidine kinase [Bacillus thuringiensis]MED2830387.1 HAMP domain-containing sensor histidine kinase [Bacillus thuringiensis]MED2834258.1 HAMP domain-containing sensor histidine kinase [Bacillus thuringiensis]MED2849989.1 HAMP domain-containing sensor histidine kinase [Bacillus thuringiensis]
MKRLSIKMKVTLWYTGLIVIIMALVLAFILTSSDKVLLFNMKDQLKSTVKESMEDIEYKHGQLKIDDDFETLEDGVNISIYSKQGELLVGHSPTSFNKKISLKSDEIQTIKDGNKEWIVYDFLHNAGGDEQVWVRGIMTMNQLSSTMNTLIVVTIISFPLLILIAAFGGYFITQRAFRPVQQMSDSASKIGDGKDLSKRINLQGSRKDEMYHLAQTFDKMFERLETSFESEKQFTSDASHELRTPTSVIISQCEYALSQRTNPKEMEESLEVILKQSHKMSALISQLLLLARADQGNHNTFQFECINMSELTEIVVEELSLMVQEASIDITTHIEEDLFIKADQTLMMRLLMNLLTNAIAYSKASGTVHMQLFRDETNIIGKVSDNGIGISEQHITKIWDRFYRVDAARTSSNIGNTGLGLSMVKWIVELHGGEITVESKLGEGSTFTFKLPIEKRA